MLAMFPVALGAQRLSKADVEKLHSARIADSVVIQTIDSRGIDFELSPDTMVELKTAGFSDAVLAALVRASGAKTVSPQPQGDIDQYSQVKSLYHAGKYGEVVDYLTKWIQQDPKAFKARALLVLTYLRLNEAELASKEYQSLANLSTTDANARQYSEQARKVLEAIIQQNKIKTELAQAIRELRGAEASKLAEQLSFDATQRDLLLIYLETLRGDFTEADKRLVDTKGIS
jgi:thioredoxin-like negative regulator of GroEL